MGRTIVEAFEGLVGEYIIKLFWRVCGRIYNKNILALSGQGMNRASTFRAGRLWNLNFPSLDPDH